MCVCVVREGRQGDCALTVRAGVLSPPRPGCLLSEVVAVLRVLLCIQEGPSQDGGVGQQRRKQDPRDGSGGGGGGDMAD